MNKLLLICGLTLALATFISLTTQPIPIEQRLIQVQADDLLNDFPGIEAQPLEVKAILLDIADDPLLLLKAEAAFLRYPDMARAIFPMYGTEPEFQDILRRYGENILPPIHHFVSRPISSIELLSQAVNRYQSFRQYINDTADNSTPDNATPSQQVASSPGKLSPEERGWYAVNFIQSEGHDFLGQFIVDAQGDTQWVGTERVLEGVNQFFASGIRNLEINYRLGDTISAGDIGWASVDALAFAGALKVLRMGRAISATTKGASRSTRSAAFAARVTQSGRMVLSGAHYAKWPVIIGAGYLLITHPTIINDLLAGIAEVLDYPVPVIQIAGWFLLLLPLLYLARWLLWLVTPLLTGLLQATQFTLYKLSGREQRKS